jgi:hypothetical protein
MTAARSRSLFGFFIVCIASLGGCASHKAGPYEVGPGANTKPTGASIASTGVASPEPAQSQEIATIVADNKAVITFPL